MQSKVFVTVSIALFSMTIFYALPAILQLLVYYFHVDGWLATTAFMLIQYGAEFNGILNALIYLFKHQEFRESSKHLVLKLTRKVAHFNSNHKISNHVYVY
uniref:G-protein coupled receptors family 1 profile domain-containing protein n=1 Tax=Acrobeloides nanus TaxID=290746 RepID=A0A914CFG3_9BILA